MLMIILIQLMDGKKSEKIQCLVMKKRAQYSILMS